MTMKLTGRIESVLYFSRADFAFNATKFVERSFLNLAINRLTVYSIGPPKPRSLQIQFVTFSNLSFWESLFPSWVIKAKQA
jgi:hypothetical protein